MSVAMDKSHQRVHLKASVAMVMSVLRQVHLEASVAAHEVVKEHLEVCGHVPHMLPMMVILKYE